MIGEQLFKAGLLITASVLSGVFGHTSYRIYCDENAIMPLQLWLYINCAVISALAGLNIISAVTYAKNPENGNKFNIINGFTQQLIFIGWFLTSLLTLLGASSCYSNEPTVWTPVFLEIIFFAIYAVMFLNKTRLKKITNDYIPINYQDN